MKNNISILLAATASGIALVKLSAASFLAAVPGEILISGLAAAAIVGMAIADYSRSPRPLTIRTKLLRPVAVSTPARASKVYGATRRNAIVERSAA